MVSTGQCRAIESGLKIKKAKEFRVGKNAAIFMLFSEFLTISIILRSTWDPFWRQDVQERQGCDASISCGQLEPVETRDDKWGGLPFCFETSVERVPFLGPSCGWGGLGANSVGRTLTTTHLIFFTASGQLLQCGLGKFSLHLVLLNYQEETNWY